MNGARSWRAAAALETGAWAERAALVALALKGYRPLARRYGGKGGEIDLIAKRGRTIIFVEVKARAAEADAACAITAENIRPVNRRIRDWQARNPWAESCTPRADAVFIGRGAWPRHLTSGFPVDML